MTETPEEFRKRAEHIAIAEEFSRLYRQMEHDLKRGGFLKNGPKRADADWGAFAERLGASFFDEVCNSGNAATLITKPPRKLMSTMKWEPEELSPLRTVRQLFENGICQVRHNYSHGEKYIGDVKDIVRENELVARAKWTLEFAKRRFEDATKS
jgi:hypothetical protein